MEPDSFDEMANGFQSSQLLLAANRLGLFDALGTGSESVPELARDLETDPRGTRILCDALAGLGILEKKQDRFSNTEEGKRHLLSSSPQSIHYRLLHRAVLYEKWGRLAEVVRQGRPVIPDDLEERFHHGEAEFAMAMAETARVSARATAARLDLSSCNRLLDVGGGAGVYSVEFCRQFPRLRCVILDRPETLQVARMTIQEAGFSERISFRAGDAYEDTLGENEFDFILVSNLIHIYSPQENQRLVRACSRSLNEGGRLCVKDFILNDDRHSPPGAAVFAVNMLVNTEHGDCYTRREIGDWFTAAGLEEAGIVNLTTQSSLLLARRPRQEELQ